MAWSPVLSAESASEGADQANKAVTLQLVQQVSFSEECSERKACTRLHQDLIYLTTYRSTTT